MMKHPNQPVEKQVSRHLSKNSVTVKRYVNISVFFPPFYQTGTIFVTSCSLSWTP